MKKGDATTTTTVKYACMIVPRRGRRRSGARVQQYGLSHGTIEEAEEFVEQHPEVEWEIHHVATTTVRTRVR